MRLRKVLGSLTAAGVLVATIAFLPNCSSALTSALQGCDGIDAKASKADAAVKAFVDAATALNAQAAITEGKFKDACNGMDVSLGISGAPFATAAAACGALNKYVKDDLAKGITVTVDIPFTCEADLNLQADCQAQCAVAASCDVRLACDPGKLVVDCNGTCDAQCDVTGPSVDCQGSCNGSCDVVAAAACQGSCSGSCSGGWEGSCDAGCTGTFKGSCGGNCQGTCDGTAASGTKCAGTCNGTCSAQAKGTCTTQCTSNFKGSCSANCSGSCQADVSVTCGGKCNGTCSYTKPTATCTGGCHGKCSTEGTRAPRCDGALKCTGTANCEASCSASASAHFTCTKPTVVVTVSGDDKLAAAINAKIDLYAMAVNETLAMVKPIGELGKNTYDAIRAMSDLTAAGGVCIVQSLDVVNQASVSINVSVSVSASVQGQASTS
jgi:hypothetical protein